jgi:ribonuclease HI
MKQPPVIPGTITFYTDGSCNAAHRVGAWAAIILCHDEKKILQGTAHNTTHQRMELAAVISAFQHIRQNNLSAFPMSVYTDSQYIVNLPARKEKLRSSAYITGRQTILPNADLLEIFFTCCEGLNITLVKVKAHQRQQGNENLNREADMLCRAAMRECIDTVRKK